MLRIKLAETGAHYLLHVADKKSVHLITTKYDTS